MNWYDELSDAQIEWAKNNKAVGELLSEEEWAIIEAIPLYHLQRYMTKQRWDDVNYIERDDVDIYRLRPDWQRPEPIKVERHTCPKCGTVNTDNWPLEVDGQIIHGGCQNCWEGHGPEKEKAGRWKYYDCKLDFYDTHAQWYISWHGSIMPLYAAESIKGFGGIEFKEWPGDWHMTLQLVCPAGAPYSFELSRSSTLKPATPSRVRFWVEG